MKITLVRQNIIEIEELLKDVSYRHAKPIMQYLAALSERQNSGYDMMTPMPTEWKDEKNIQVKLP